MPRLRIRLALHQPYPYCFVQELNILTKRALCFTQRFHLTLWIGEKCISSSSYPITWTELLCLNNLGGELGDNNPTAHQIKETWMLTLLSERHGCLLCSLKLGETLDMAMSGIFLTLLLCLPWLSILPECFYWKLQIPKRKTQTGQIGLNTYVMKKCPLCTPIP